MIFDYYYGEEAEQFSFLRIPKLLITDKTFADVSFGAKLLYGVLLDRMSLSIKNRWLDEENRVFIIFKVSEIEDSLAISEKMAIKYMRELEQIGLIEKKRRGLGLPSLLYVKTFMNKGDSRTVEKGSSESDENAKITSISEENKDNSAEKDGFEQNIHEKVEGKKFRPSQIDSSGPSQIDSSRTAQKEVQDLPKSTALNNNTKLIKTNKSNTETNLISSYRDEVDEEERMLDEIRERIGYESFLISHPEDIGMVDGIVDLIHEVNVTKATELTISSMSLPIGIVRERFNRIRYAHVDYILNALSDNTEKIKNIKKYLLAMMFNAPATIEGYYTVEVGHNMARFAI